jgi:hypothetical protein
MSMMCTCTCTCALARSTTPHAHPTATVGSGRMGLRAACELIGAQEYAYASDDFSRPTCQPAIIIIYRSDFVFSMYIADSFS